MPNADFTVRILARNPHQEGTQIWKAGLIVTGMEGCEIEEIVQALTAFERARPVGVQAPARWITHFAGLESKQSGKAMAPWLEIIHMGRAIASREQFKVVLSSRGRTAA